MSARPPAEGSFGVGEFAGLLRAFNGTSAAGRLDVNAAKANCALFISDGKVDAIAADEERFKLGSWLAARGVLDPGGMAVALLKQPPDVPFGEYLVDEGLLDAERLAQELRLRAAAVIGLLLFTPGSYRFKEGEGPTGGKAIAMELDTTSVLLAAARNSDTSQLEEWAINGGGRVRVQPSAMEAARNTLLSPQEAYLLSRIDGKTSTDGLRHLVPMSGPDLFRALGALIFAGLAELQAEPSVAAPAQGVADAPLYEDADSEKAGPAPRVPEEVARQRREIERLAAEIGGRDYYRRLGLSRGATQDQVHQRFKEMTRLYSTELVQERHLGSLRGQLERIQEALVEAYRTLTDPTQRSQYDEHLKGGGATAGGEVYQAQERQASARRKLVEANLKRAQELTRMGQLGEAIQLLEQAVRLDPQPETLLGLARLELRNPMWSQRALDRLRLALSTDSKFTEGWLELATFWAKRKKTDRQRECLRRILEYDPENVEAQRALVSIGTV